VSELVAVNLSDFKRVDVLLVRGKGRKERLVPVTECSEAAIAAWLPVREQLLMDFNLQTDALLFSVGPRHSFERLDVRSASRIVKRIALAKGLPAYHPHLLRHACGTHLHDNGVPILPISRLLGHARLETTEIYTRVSTGRMLDVYRKAHPHARPSR
jgi:integrase/recombinase XerC